MRLKNIKAVILKKREFMENDLIVVVLNDEGKRMDLVVKGAQNSGSRRKNHLELMNLISGTLYQGKTHLYLQSVRAEKSFHHLKSKFERIMKLSLMMEIIEKSVLENDPHPEIYELLLASLHTSNQKEINEASQEAALIKLAHYLGFLPNFKNCSLCHRALSEDQALWDQNAGTLSCSTCGKEHLSLLPLKYRKALDFFSKAPESECKKVILNAEELHALREFIPGLFLAHLDKPLKTLTF